MTCGSGFVEEMAADEHIDEDDFEDDDDGMDDQVSWSLKVWPNKLNLLSHQGKTKTVHISIRNIEPGRFSIEAKIWFSEDLFAVINQGEKHICLVQKLF